MADALHEGLNTFILVTAVRNILQLDSSEKDPIVAFL